MTSGAVPGDDYLMSKRAQIERSLERLRVAFSEVLQAKEAARAAGWQAMVDIHQTSLVQLEARIDRQTERLQSC